MALTLEEGSSSRLRPKGAAARIWWFTWVRIVVSVYLATTGLMDHNGLVSIGYAGKPCSYVEINFHEGRDLSRGRG